MFAVWPLKNSDSLLTKSGESCTVLLSGKMICSFQPSSSDFGSAYMPLATMAASRLFGAWVVTAKADPPQFTETGLAGSHCGSGAAAQTPLDEPLPTPAPVR